jgi:hypothetical protein
MFDVVGRCVMAPLTLFVRSRSTGSDGDGAVPMWPQNGLHGFRAEAGDGSRCAGGRSSVGPSAHAEVGDYSGQRVASNRSREGPRREAQAVGCRERPPLPSTSSVARLSRSLVAVAVFEGNRDCEAPRERGHELRWDVEQARPSGISAEQNREAGSGGGPGHEPSTLSGRSAPTDDIAVTQTPRRPTCKAPGWLITQAPLCQLPAKLSRL